MCKELEFHVVKNKLDRVPIAALTIENQYYLIQIFYTSDYNADRTNHKISVSDLTMQCKPKNTELEITYNNGVILIETLTTLILTVEETDAFKKEVDIAKHSAIALADVLRSYFGEDAVKTITERNRKT